MDFSLSIYINSHSGLEFHGKFVLVDGDLFYQARDEWWMI